MPRLDHGGFATPPHSLGADLCWWRETGDVHTLVSLFWDRHPRWGASIRLELALFDGTGRLAGCCTLEPHADQPIFIDSQAPPGSLRDAPPVEDGVLAIFASTLEPPPLPLRTRYLRLFSLIDWYSDDGLICSLHNDQSVTAPSNGHRFTEMVVDESDAHESYLVICNGPHAHGPGAITFVVQNHRGERRGAVFDEPLRPFSANRLRIRELVPDAVAFADGQPMAISGSHRVRDLFIRPYVMTTGPFLSGYHGGDLSTEGAISPAHEHRFLDRGKVNPMYAVHRPDLTTTVDLFNTHTTLDDHFWVDLYLYDETGALVSDRPRWLLARRDAPTRGHIADVLPPDRQTFTGHLVLAFSHDDKPAYPRTLQALVAYRTPHSTTRVMLWSDEMELAATGGKAPGRAVPGVLPCMVPSAVRDGDLHQQQRERARVQRDGTVYRLLDQRNRRAPDVHR